ncbi:hypothetical protein [Frankia sp. QA3]|uniref:hypothetical protein n=1 Tax=Frankia sp. QA3 TaxID=710111 RepID=UPI000269CF6E|nr:hypothetical protein [Frankia sp. QA3]EIV96339.1 hypothetical protein FraQA3DRAFT_6226 [Frankia sp. QA3]
MDPVLVAASTVVAGNVLALVELSLRLRSSRRQEDAHRRLLVDLAQTLPPGSALLERRPDGTRLAMIVKSNVAN